MNKKILILSTVLMFNIVNAKELSVIDVKKSKIEFTYKQMGVAVTGNFKSYKSTTNLDLNNLNKSKVNMTIDLNSINTGSDEGNNEVLNKTWFDVKLFPTATFNSKEIKQIDKNKLNVLGTLSIKGKSKDISIPVNVLQNSFEGNFDIKRSEFDIGIGEWAKFDLIDNPIKVNFKIILN